MRTWTATSGNYALSLRSSSPIERKDFVLDQVCELGEIQYRILKYKYLQRWFALVQVPRSESSDHN